MADEIVALDVGTTKVCALIARWEGNVPRILGVGIERSRGMRKGQVTDVQALSEAIARAVERAARTAGVEVNAALVSMAGAEVSGETSRGVVGVSGGMVTQQDVARALDAAQAIAIPHNREVVHVIQRGFRLDGNEVLRIPVGMYGYRLEAEVYIITATRSAMANLRQAVESAGVQVTHFVLNPLAAGEAVLREDERELGVAVCDIGGGTTDLAVYIDGDVCHTAVIPLGGWHLTNDLAQVLHLPPDHAEDVKKRHGHALVREVPPEEFVTLHPYGERRGVPVLRREVVEILEARVREMLEFVQHELQRSGYAGLLPAGVVFTGGSSLLNGLVDVAREMLGVPVRVARPERVVGLADRVRSPAFATSVGLLYWARLLQGPAEREAVAASAPRDWRAWLRQIFEWLLP